MRNVTVVPVTTLGELNIDIGMSGWGVRRSWPTKAASNRALTVSAPRKGADVHTVSGPALGADRRAATPTVARTAPAASTWARAAARASGARTRVLTAAAMRQIGTLT